ncbi:hypothetical protein [Leeia sp.]|uniref:hypothetical protein n=1 Tax=Leeia sp. TaxID=2884678 RepID=UPI0035B43BA0
MSDLVSGLPEFFSTDLPPGELPMLRPLLAARPLLQAFIALFRGGEEEVMVRLLVLREIGARADLPRWSPQALQQQFSYLNPVKLDTVLKRLREHDLLIWDSDSGDYALSEQARAALAALSTLFSFASDPDQELDYLTSQVAAGQAVGKVSEEALRHLLGGLNTLHQEFTDALESQSEFRIQAAQGKLERVWQSVEKATAVARTVYSDEEQPVSIVHTAQAISLAQSRMLALTGTFKRRLAQLQQQRVHLGQSGLTTRDISAWLQQQSQARLANLLEALLPALPDTAFLTSDELLDVAEFELIDRDRPQTLATSLPPVETAPDADAPTVERLIAAERLFERLQAVHSDTRLLDAVLTDSYATTAYRLSLLSLLGDPETATDHSVVAQLARLPLQLDSDGRIETVTDHHAIESISHGLLRPLNPTDESA